MFTDIILAITPSELCDCAAQAGFAFANKHEANITLVHVCGLPSHGWGSIEHLIPSGEVDKIKNKIVEHYKDLLNECPKSKVEVVPGMPHSEILRLARRYNSDLIVMGPHTKEFAERRSKMWGMAGSTLERVSQKARCPVMIVSREVPKERMQFSNIVAATDFSEQAECAVGYAGQMARHYKAGLSILHVLDVSAELLSQQEIEARVKDSTERMKEEFSPRLEGISNYSFECCEGSPAMEILKFARQKNADLIIMAHHSKERDPEKAYLGSTVAQVALNAACPTMSVNRHFDLRCGLFYDQTGAVTQQEAKQEA